MQESVHAHKFRKVIIYIAKNKHILTPTGNEHHTQMARDYLSTISQSFIFSSTLFSERSQVNVVVVAVFFLLCRSWHKHCTLHAPESWPVFTTLL